MSKFAWDDKKDEILLSYIKANSFNRSEAFRKASSELKTTFFICSSRWYQVLSKIDKTHTLNNQTNVCFISITKGKAIINKNKDKTGDNSIELSSNAFKKILELLK